jgi:beta-xylosidase
MTKKFVMWMHIDSEDYSFARAGVATSSKPTGPYKYYFSMQPNNHMSRDMTLFKDDDGKAYHIYSSEDNSTLHISQLSDDYLTPSGKFIRIMENNYREAPAMFKSNGKYYLITSGCTGWDSNAANYAVADSIMGKWQIVGNPCIGDGSDKTFQSQSTFVLPIAGKKDSFIFMADRWNKTNLEDSRYIWLPIRIDNDKIIIKWMDAWNLNFFNK